MTAVIPSGCVPACPGCAHRGWERSESLAQKFQWLERRLALWHDRLEPVKFCESGPNANGVWGYRDKTCLSAEWDSSCRRWKLGLKVRKRGLSGESGTRSKHKEYEVIDIPDCPVHSERVRRVITEFGRSLPGPDVLPLRFVLVTGALATLVLKCSRVPENFWGSVRLEDLARELGLEGILINFNPSAGERVLASKGWHLIWGNRSARLNTELGEFEYGPESFQQLIPSLSLQALSDAETFLRPRRGDSVVDLCSGIGISLRKWRIAGARTLGVELGGDAVAHALKNVPEGEICLRGRASERIPQFESWLKAKSEGGRTLVYANPPRLGLETEVVEWLARGLRPDAIAYLSCSAGTLARDLSHLSDSGYRVVRIIPYDFFPQTPHVETLALVERES